ncbi:MAG: SDR family NAD(P)-dependent oxidoreductase [Betaproteobacteria bacterium]|nr:SDR family NAD(P)-dependent oxidoreductase [Betaproteobacteria bacterium]
MDLGLKGKACIVTGASRGIGIEVARVLAGEGADVALLARDSKRLEAVAAEIRSGGTRAFPVVADLSTEQGVAEGMQSAIRQLGRVDVLINNAGSSPLGSFDKVTDADWLESFALKPMGYVRAIRAVLPAMRAQHRGRIVNVIGAGGRWAVAEYVMGSMNAAALHLTKSLAELLGPEGITVTAVNPGPTGPTERLDKVFKAWSAHHGRDEAEFKAEYIRGLPLRRMATTVEMARLIVLMASELTEYTTGGALQADGATARGVI